jgi:hypothetical protein
VEKPQAILNCRMIGNGGQLQHYAAFDVPFSRITNYTRMMFLVKSKTAMRKNNKMAIQNN